MPPAFSKSGQRAPGNGRAPRHALVSSQLILPDALSAPSAMLTTMLAVPAELRTSTIAPGIELRGSVLTKATDKGTALHEAFRILLQKPDRVAAVAAHCRISEVDVEVLVKQAEALRAALCDLGYPTLHVEQPLDIALGDGTFQTVIVDLLAQGPDGFIIVDHKSGPVPAPADRFTGYWPQLAAYVRAIEKIGAGAVRAAAIFWTHTGEMTLGTL